jgi:thiol-disulfide isomerase/thioredoxin
MHTRTVLAAGLLLTLATFAAAEPPKVTVRTVRYDGLTDAIKAAKGKVLVVDFWADYCIPCKREFPRLVALHQKRAADGFAAISVSLDDPADEATPAKVKKFLEARQATFANFILDEKPEVWQAKLKVDGPPCVYVFNRKGELVQKYSDDVNYAEIEKLVDKLLKE